MSRVLTILQSEFPYNISARCLNQEWFNIPMSRVWKIFCEELTDVNQKHELLIHSFVLMSNHFHLIASTPKANISQCMNRFMSRTSLRLAKDGNRINETYAGRHYKCILQSHNYYLNAYKYNYRNPVMAGICNQVQDYQFSSLPSVIGVTNFFFPLVMDATYQSDPVGTLDWLNQAPTYKKIEAARCGFKHQYFKSKKCETTGRPILGQNDIL